MPNNKITLIRDNSMALKYRKGSSRDLLDFRAFKKQSTRECNSAFAERYFFLVMNAPLLIMLLELYLAKQDTSFAK